MKVIIEMIDSLNQPVQLLVLIGLLCWVSNRMVAGRDDIRAAAHRLATISLVSYFGYAVLKFEPVSADQFLGIAIRALFAAGLTLGFSGVFLAVVVFVYERTIKRFNESRSAARTLEQRKAQELRWGSEAPAAVGSRQEAAVQRVVEKSREELVVEVEREYADRIAAIDLMSCEDDEKTSRRLRADKDRMRKMARILK